jgi:hypothetical protein
LVNKDNIATSALWLLCAGRQSGGAFAFALNLLWLLSFFQEKESDNNAD